MGLPLPKPPSVPLHRGQKTAGSWSRPSPAVSPGGLDHRAVPEWGPQSRQISPMPCSAVGQRLGWSQTCTLLKVHRYKTLSRVIAWGAGVGEDRVSPQMLAAPSHWEAPTEALLAGCRVRGAPGAGGGHRRAGRAASGSQGAAAQGDAHRPQKQAEAEGQEAERVGRPEARGPRTVWSFWRPRCPGHSFRGAPGHMPRSAPTTQHPMSYQS